MDERNTPNSRRELEDPEDGPEFDDRELSRDLEVEDKVSDWLETNKIENDLPTGILYKFTAPTGDAREQVDFFRGVMPSRHDIGLQYGSGRYMLLLRNTTAQKGRKSTSLRFTLHASYELKHAEYLREQAEKARLSQGVVNPPPAVVPPQNGKETLLEAFTLVRSMQNDTLNMFRPLLERLLTIPAAPAKSASPFDDYALSRQIMKDSLKENLSMIATVQKTLLEHKPPADLDDEDLPEEKQSLFEKIIALAEPFINILAQNNMAGKIAAAGIKAAPQFKEVIHDASLARRIISYVETKEGPERAGIALKNLGISRDDYTKSPAQGAPSRPPVNAERPPAPPVRKLPPPGKSPGHTAPAAGGKSKKLNPKMEVKV